MRVAGTQFTDDEFALAYPPGVELHYWQLARNRIIQSQLEKFAPREARILEVGCGRGIVVSYLQARGFDCFGVELAALKVPETLKDRMFTGLRASELPRSLRQSFTVLLLLDVIEHIEKPEQFLSALLQDFPHVRMVIITVPARPELWSNYDTFYRHYRRYTLNALTTTMSSQSGRIRDLRYFCRLLYLPARLITTLAGKRTTSFSSPGRAIQGLHRVMGWLLVLDYALLPRRIPGTSAICTFDTKPVG